MDPTVQLEYLQTPTIEREHIIEIHQAPCWMDPIIAFLEKETLPDDIIEAQKLERRADKFLIHEGKLLRKSITKTDMHPFLQCLRPEEAELALLEIHEGMCGNHAGARTLVHKAVRQGYYWPSILQEARDLVQKCLKCQKFSSFTHTKATELIPIVNPIPFAQWGIDLIGKFPIAKSGQYQFLIVV